jgi:glutathione S-transferase
MDDVMLKLCGFAGSNYYNKVKIALLEKNIPFEEQLTWVGETDLNSSPIGKVPYLLTPDGPLSESTIILEYLEQHFHAQPLLPSNSYQAAKVRELALFLDLHIELVVRNLYPEAFFGGKVSDSVKDKINAQLQKNIQGLSKLMQFKPFVAGDAFTLADCAAITHLPLVSAATKKIYGTDFLAQLPVKDYLSKMNERASVKQVNEDRKINTALFLERIKNK